MDPQKKHKQFARFLEYVLGRRPDEFGLAPDDDGYVKIKELIKAINEDANYTHIKKSNIDEIIVSVSPCPVEADDNKIRAADRENLVLSEIPEKMPKIIYTAIRQKAHPYVFEKGIFPSHHEKVVLASEIEMAERIGQRSDKEPVILHINTEQAEKMGVLFTQLGKLLYLSRFIPANCITGPPLPKQKAEAPRKKPDKAVKKPATFNDIMESDDFVPPKQKDKSGKRRDKTSWKDNKKRIRKGKIKDWPM